jgi:hypothetical protein
MKIKKIFMLLMATLITSILSACSSITTIMEPEINDADGITYYMPKKDFIVTVVVSDEGKSVISSVSSAYPDLSKQFVIKYNYNAFGDNLLKVDIKENGLLTNINSKTVSQVNEIFEALAKSAGYITALGVAEQAPVVCSNKGTYIFKFTEEVNNGEICNGEIKVTISKTEEINNITPHSKESKKEYSGIFYRQDIPYTISIEGAGIKNDTIVFSPSESPVHYLPISRSFFADNEATLILSDGVVTSYKQDNKSELLAIASLPADILEAYFSAITSAFTTGSNANKAEATALSDSIKLEIAKMKYQACIAAIKENNSELTEQLNCSK